MRAAQTFEWKAAATEVVTNVRRARILPGQHVVVQHDRFDPDGAEFEVLLVENSGHRTSDFWKSHAALSASEGWPKASTVAVQEVNSDAAGYGQVAMTWGEDSWLRIYDAEAGQLQEITVPSAMSVTSSTIIGIRHSQLGFAGNAKLEVVLLYTTGDRLWVHSLPVRFCSALIFPFRPPML